MFLQQVKLMKTRLLRYWSYFRRGHNIYLAFIISFMNFIVIQYRLLIQAMPLRNVISSLWMFALLFLTTYIPSAVIIGWLDYKRLAVPVETALTAKANPWVKDLSKALILIAEGKPEEAKKLLKRWTE